MGIDELYEIFKDAYYDIIKLNIKLPEPSKLILGIDKAKRRLGVCKKRNRYNNLIKRYEINFIITIAKRVLESKDMVLIKKVLIHELLHTVEGCLNHGKEWKLQADKVNKAYGYEISRLIDISEHLKNGVIKTEYSYILRCKYCGKEYKRHRKTYFVENPSEYGCGKCKKDGGIELIKNN